MISRQTGRALAAAFVALAVLAGAFLTAWGSPARSQEALLAAAPAELAVPADPQQLGQWCRDRQAQGTAGLTSRARAWLTDCVTLFGGPAGSPSASPSATQSASPSLSPSVQPSPSVTPSATTPPATTPPASPTPSPTGLLTGCFARLVACGYPDLTTTGVPAGTVLTAYPGPTTIRTTAVIEGKTMGCLTIPAGGNVTIRKSKITGPCFYGIDMEGGTLLIEDSEINCVNGKGSGIAWAKFAAKRVYIHDCENALEMGQSSSVEDSYLAAREGDSSAHGDDIQSQGGNDVVIRHNTFAGVNPITSSIITNPTQNQRWLVEGNFLSSGAFTLYCPEQGTMVVRGNRFYPAKTGSPHSASYGLTDACGHSGITWTGNYRDDNLAALGSNS